MIFAKFDVYVSRDVYSVNRHILLVSMIFAKFAVYVSRDVYRANRHIHLVSLIFGDRQSYL